MGRRRKQRIVDRMPVAEFFKPHGVRLDGLTGVTLPVEGAEALRLVDAEGMGRDEAAERMGVSTPTLCRILAEARRIVARAVTGGLALRIEGGDYCLRDRIEEDAPSPHGGRARGPGSGGGQGRGGGPGQGRGGGRGYGR